MTPQERSLLEGFLAQLAQVRGLNKDPEAERLIARAVEQQPDATYLVVQRALLLGQALEQAKARIAALEQGEGRGQGFLDPNASGWGNPGSGPGGLPRSAWHQRRLLSMRPHTHQPTARRLLAYPGVWRSAAGRRFLELSGSGGRYGGRCGRRRVPFPGNREHVRRPPWRWLRRWRVTRMKRFPPRMSLSTITTGPTK